MQVAIVFQEENGDFSVWFPDRMLSDFRFEQLMIDYETDGSSVSGTARQIAKEIFGKEIGGSENA